MTHLIKKREDIDNIPTYNSIFWETVFCIIRTWTQWVDLSTIFGSWSIIYTRFSLRTKMVPRKAPIS
ncbi:hypothetical protein TI04_08845 [Achromatium sp. WMS2]|nr:hypothetical protein TI04_08845 [Achromatium sp. WMS2]